MIPEQISRMLDETLWHAAYFGQIAPVGGGNWFYYAQQRFIGYSIFYNPSIGSLDNKEFVAFITGTHLTGNNW